MATRPNQHEESARERKAYRLMSVLLESECTAAAVPHLDDQGWDLACGVAFVNHPSEATKVLVAEMMARHEARVAKPVTDPFEGLS